MFDPVRPTASLLEGRRLEFRKLRAIDLLSIAPQPSQRVQYGQPVELSIEEAHGYAAGAFAWTAWDGDRVVACLGVAETFPGAAGLAWALFDESATRREMAQVTRFARDTVIGTNPLPRIEAVVRCADVEEFAEFHRVANPGGLHCFATMRPTPQLRWAMSVGLSPVAVLRKFGAANETHMLMERIL